MSEINNWAINKILLLLLPSERRGIKAQYGLWNGILNVYFQLNTNTSPSCHRSWFRLNAQSVGGRRKISGRGYGETRKKILLRFPELNGKRSWPGACKEPTRNLRGAKRFAQILDKSVPASHHHLWLIIYKLTDSTFQLAQLNWPQTRLFNIFPLRDFASIIYGEHH